LVNFIYKNKRVAWSVDKDREGYLAGRRYNVMEDDLGKKVIDYTGEIIRVKL
jgi:hypothetical protein